MEVNVRLDLPIKAFPKDEHYLLPKEKLDVKEIHMGQTNTSIFLMGYGYKTFNSIHFDFYLHNKKIDIYKSGLINNYYTLHLKGIHFLEE